MERCRDRGGDYIEGDNISIVTFFFNKELEHESGFFIATRIYIYKIHMQLECIIRRHITTETSI